MEVVHLEPAMGGKLALNLLRSTAGDVHLRAFAFSMLYRANRTVAYEYARENAGSCEAPVFLAMLGEVAEDIGLLNESSELQQVIADLRSAISHRTDSDTEVVKRGVHDFLAAHGNRD